jgi:hypothetical protein
VEGLRNNKVEKGSREKCTREEEYIKMVRII